MKSKVIGLMEEEKDLIRKIQNQPVDGAVEFVTQLLADSKQKGRFTSVAVALAADSDRTECILERLKPVHIHEIKFRLNAVSKFV